MSGTEKLLLDAALVALIIVLVWMGLRRNGLDKHNGNRPL
jgi:hypothetical protein